MLLRIRQHVLRHIAIGKSRPSVVGLDLWRTGGLSFEASSPSNVSGLRTIHAKSSQIGLDRAASRSSSVSAATTLYEQPYDNQTRHSYKRISVSTRKDWEDSAFWTDIAAGGYTIERVWHLQELLSRILKDEASERAFLLQSPLAFCILLDASVASNKLPHRMMREKLCFHIYRQYVSSGSKPQDGSKVYSKMMSVVLRHQADQALQAHKRLAHLPPTENELASLILEIAQSELATRKFQQFCTSLSTLASAYSEIISCLCKAKLYDTALSWHELLASKGCGPPNVQSAEPLRSHLVATNQVMKLHEFDQTVDKAIMQRFVTHLEHTSPQGKKNSGEFSDNTVARGLATRFLSVDTAIEGLKLFGVATLGPLALRQLVLRTSTGSQCDLNSLRSYFDHLSRAEIQVGNSLFSRLVRKLLRAEQAHLLYEIASCDMHCDAFEDMELQESLYGHYSGTGDNRAARRTMAILLADTPLHQEQARRLNLQLKDSLAKNDRLSVEKTLEEILVSCVNVDYDCLQVMYYKLLRERFAQSDGMTNLLTTIWMRLMDSHLRLYVPMRWWSVAMRTLLAQGSFATYESLSWKLPKWYAETARAFDIRKQRQQPNKSNAELWPALDATQRALTSELFTNNHLTDLVQYGLHYGRMLDTDGRLLRAQIDAVGFRPAMAAHPMLWGVQMGLLLNAAGIPIDREVFITRAQSRIGAMCGRGIILPNGHTVRPLPRTTVEDYLAGVEELAGIPRNVQLD